MSKKKLRKGDVVIVDREWWHFLGVIFCYCNHLNVYFVEFGEDDDNIFVYGFDSKVLTKIEGRL